MEHNILIALPAETSFSADPKTVAYYKRMLDAIKDHYIALFEKSSTQEFPIGRVDFVYSREEIEDTLLSFPYDIFLCTDRLNGEGIGIGTIRSLKERFFNLSVFLLIEPIRKGDGKLANLYLEGYYNALYANEAAGNAEGFLNVLKNGRTKEEAYEYYGLSDSLLDRMMEGKGKIKAHSSDNPERMEEKEVLNSLSVKEKEKESVILQQEEPKRIPNDLKEQKEPEPYEEKASYYPVQSIPDLNGISATHALIASGVIAEIISDDVLLIRLDGGGFFQKRERLKEYPVNIIIKED